MKTQPQELVVTAPAPSSPSVLHLGPVALDPILEGSERLVEGPAEFGELVKRGRLNATRVDVTHDQAVAFSSPKGVGEHFVGDAVEGAIEVLVAASSVGKLRKHSESPTPAEQLNELRR